MMDTIRAAKAFFGPKSEDAAQQDGNDEPTATAAAMANDAPPPDAVTGTEPDMEVATVAATEPAPVPAAPDGPAVARVQRLNSLSMRDATTEEPPREDPAEDDGEAATEALLDEIACEIVEDALVALDDEVEDGFAAEVLEEPAEDQPLLFLPEEDLVEEQPADEDPRNSTLLFDDVEKTVVAVTAEPVQAADTGEDDVGNGEPAAEKATVTVPLRRDRRRSPRLPIDGLVPPHAEGAAETRQHEGRGRAAAAPKWSASARHHMSDMLATSGRESAPAIRARSGVELPRIDLRPDRHRQSSAMILLGLPAMLLVGFGAAYVYHASTYDPSQMLEGARNAIPASIASIPTIGVGTAKPTRKISESIIQKQEEKVAATVRSEPLPPPVAPPLVEPTESRASPAAPRVAGAARTETAIETPPLPEPTRIEPAAAPVTSALMVAHSDVASAAPELPAPVAPEPRAAAAPNETTVAALPAPAPDAAAPARPKPTGVARNEPAARTTKVASLVPAGLPLPAEDGETGKLIARGNERMEIGDIAAARLLFELAAQSGSPIAATAMGRSFDPVYFLRIGVRGVKPDADKAKGWYEKAVSGGDKTAEADLQNLTVWLTEQ